MADNNTARTRKTSKQMPVDNTYGHLQPQALDVEKAVLGALMIDRDAYAVVCEILYPESFYEQRNQLIYEAIRSLSMAEKPVDILTVTNELERNGNIEKAGGPIYVTELAANVASSANIEYHARIVAQKFLARQLISFASVIETKAFDGTVDVDELMQEAEGSLFELSQRNMKKDYTQIDPVITNAIEVIQKAAANKDGLTGVPTGYHKLDDITSGWQPSDLVIIAGRPAMGKTSFALSMAKNIVAAGLARRCQVELAYAIGVAAPVSVLVETFGTGTVSDGVLSDAVQQVFDLRPSAIIRDLDLRRPIYRQLAAYGHMGREELGVTWEKTDRVDALLAAVKALA